MPPGRTLQQQDWIALNASSELLTALPVAARLLSRRLAIEKGSNLFRQGDKPNEMYFVIAGEIVLVRHAAGGDDAVLHRARRGFIAEASLDHDSYHCDGQATVASDVLAIKRTAIRRALEVPRFRDAWLAMMNQELRRTRARSERLQMRSAADRIIHFIATEGRNGTVTLSSTRKAWAADLGLTHEALYRALKSMVSAGLLVMEGPTIRTLPSVTRSRQ